MTEMATTIKETIETLTPYMEQLADKLGTTADKLWMLQVKQAYVEGITMVIQGVILILANYLLYKALIKLWKYLREHDSSEYMAFSIFAIFPIIFLDGNAVAQIKTLITLLFNPEYYALNQVILLLKGAIKF